MTEAPMPHPTQLDSSLDDNALVALTRAGRQDAFELLIRRHTSRLYGLCMGMMRNRADALDAMQDAFLNAYRRLDGFRGDAAFGSWIYRVAANACLMKLRKRRRRPEVPLEIQAPFDGDGSWERPVEDLAPRVDAAYENKELGAAIESAVGELPEMYRAVFVLSDLQHLSMREIAETLDLSVPNVKTRLHRARLKLRESLASYLAAEPTLPATTQRASL